MNVSGAADFTGDVTLGPLNTADDGGMVDIFDRSVTSGAGTNKQGVTIQTDNVDILSAYGISTGGDGTVDSIGVEVHAAGSDIVLGAYTQYVDIPIASASVGAAAPSLEEVGTVAGYGFDADAETLYPKTIIPLDWDGASDLTVSIYWTAESGDPLTDTETVKWDISYRCLDWGTDVADNGTAVDITETYTQSGAGTDKATFVSEITIDYDNINQPVTAGEYFAMALTRDVTGDSYSGTATVTDMVITYTSVGLQRAQ
jgi:hypothetical protein